MVRILVDSYPESKVDCPFCSPYFHDTCILKEKVSSNYNRVLIKCNGFENGEFNKEKCGMLKDIKEYKYKE